MSNTAIREKAFKEKDLHEIVMVYPNGFKEPFWATRMFALAAGCTFLLAVCARYLIEPRMVETASILSSLDAGAQSGIILGVGLLSIIIAGFAIFASGKDKHTVSLMLNVTQEPSGRPQIIFVYSTFIYTMVKLLSLTAYCVAVSICFRADGSIWIALAESYPEGAFLTASLALSLLIGALVFTFSILRSFVWNLYQVLLTLSLLKATMKDAD